MEFDLLEFNRKFHYYWWLVPRRPTWKEMNRRPAWGMERGWPTRSEWPRWQPPDDVVVINPKDYPTEPPSLNRKCNEGNIHQTILAEYDSIWPDATHCDLYFQIYHSISNRIILKITRNGLKDANHKAYDEANIAQIIASYLPSGLPVDADGMRNMAEELLERRKKKRLEEEEQLQKEKNLMELGRCLICRGIELVLKASELEDSKNLKTHDENSENRKKRGTKRRRSEVDKGRANRMTKVELIYLKVQEFG
jgi:hypothetical protein